jgi:hypothetical protein
MDGGACQGAATRIPGTAECMEAVWIRAVRRRRKPPHRSFRKLLRG